MTVQIPQRVRARLQGRWCPKMLQTDAFQNDDVLRSLR